MQILRYMVVIWQDYAKKENEKQANASSRKNFRYPLIIPMVYYEGKENWTAELDFASRIQFSEEAGDYVPNFQYQLVPLHKYSNQELIAHHNEMSLVMMINRIQKPKDFTAFLNESEDFVNSIYGNAPEEIRELIQGVLWSLFMKMKVPVEEADDLMHQMEEKKMGILFENVEPFNEDEPFQLQLERAMKQNAQEDARRERERADAAEAKLSAVEARADGAEARVIELEKIVAELTGSKNS